MQRVTRSGSRTATAGHGAFPAESELRSSHVGRTRPNRTNLADRQGRARSTLRARVSCYRASALEAPRGDGIAAGRTIRRRMQSNPCGRASRTTFSHGLPWPCPTPSATHPPPRNRASRHGRVPRSRSPHRKLSCETRCESRSESPWLCRRLRRWACRQAASPTDDLSRANPARRSPRSRRAARTGIRARARCAERASEPVRLVTPSRSAGGRAVPSVPEGACRRTPGARRPGCILRAP